jgi:hypothetical protein
MLKHWFSSEPSAPKSKMNYLHIKWKRSKDYEKNSGHTSKINFPYTEYNTKYTKAPDTKR